MSDMIRDFFKMESAGGILLVIAAAIAMVMPIQQWVKGTKHFYIPMSLVCRFHTGLMMA